MLAVEEIWIAISTYTFMNQIKNINSEKIDNSAFSVNQV